MDTVNIHQAKTHLSFRAYRLTLPAPPGE